MLPSDNKDILEGECDRQSDSRYSFLNVNASEFVPSTTAKETDSASFTPLDQIQTPNESSSPTKDNVAASALRQKYDNSDYNKNGGGGRDQMQVYPPLPPESTSQLQDSSIGGSATKGIDAACPQVQENAHSLFPPVSQRMYFGHRWDITNDYVIASQGQAYTHSFYSSIDPIHNFGTTYTSGCVTDYDEPMNSQRRKFEHSVVFDPAPAVDQMKVSSDYENENAVSNLQWQELAPIPCPEDNVFLNQELMQCYKEASDTAFSPGDDWDNHPEINIENTSAAASCLPEFSSLSVCTKLSSDNINEIAGEASFQPTVILNEEASVASLQTKVILNEGTIDSSITPDDRLKNSKNEGNFIEPAVVPGINDRNEEEARLSINPKHNKKKNRSRTDEEVYSKKEHVNVVFIGHVDAGKSTLGGQLMYLTGMVDKRTMNKYEKEAKEISRDSWYLSWALDTNQEERDKGKTVETGRGYFETETKHFTILDAPGHKSFVPNMICGAAQADIAVLVLSARQNEFESGFDKGGQTRDHAMLARSAGLNVLIALVNKMDDSTVKWDEKRFNYCRNKTLPFLKKLGYAPKDVYFLPISAQTGDGIMTAVPKSTCSWFEGPSFIECLDKLSPITRKVESPFVMPIAEKFNDMGTVVMGKVEAGCTHISNSLLLMPNKVTVSVEQIWSDDKSVTRVKAGENVKIRLKGIEDEDISPGFVLCDIKQPITTATLFDAQLHILDCKSIITPGFSAVMHFQSVAKDVTVTHLLCLVDPKTNVKTRKHNLQFVKKHDDAIMRLQCSGVVCLTVFKHFDQLGRFTLRDDNKVIAIGKVLKIIK